MATKIHPFSQSDLDMSGGSRDVNDRAKSRIGGPPPRAGYDGQSDDSESLGSITETVYTSTTEEPDSPRPIHSNSEYCHSQYFDGTSVICDIFVKNPFCILSPFLKVLVP